MLVHLLRPAKFSCWAFPHRARIQQDQATTNNEGSNHTFTLLLEWFLCPWTSFWVQTVWMDSHEMLKKRTGYESINQSQPYWALGWLNSDRDAKRDTTWSERFESGHVHSPFYYEWSSHNLNLWNFLCDLPFLYSMMFCVMQGFFRSNWMSGRSKARKPNRIMNFSMSWVGLMLDSLRPIVIMGNPSQDSVKNCHHFLVPMSWSECPTIFHIKGQSNFFSDPFHFGTGASPWWGSAIHVQPLRTCKGALHVLHQFVRWPLALWVRNSGQYRALHRDVGGDARFSPIDVQKTHHNVVVTSEANMRTAIVTKSL